MVRKNCYQWGLWASIGLGTLVGCGSTVPENGPTLSRSSESSKTASEQGVVEANPGKSDDTPRQPLMAPSAQPLMVPAMGIVPQVKPEIDVEAVAEVEELIQKLTSPGTSPEEWEQAHTKIVAMGAQATPTLAKQLASDDVFERETAASMLVLLGPHAAQAKEQLHTALNDSSPFVKANVAVALVTIGECQREACQVLVRSLQSHDEQLRQMAAMNLSVLGDEAKGFVSDLTFVLSEEKSPEVLVPVVQLLGRLGPEATDAVPRLKQIAFEQDGPLKAEASAAINSIRQASLQGPGLTAP